MDSQRAIVARHAYGNTGLCGSIRGKGQLRSGVFPCDKGIRQIVLITVHRSRAGQCAGVGEAVRHTGVEDIRRAEAQRVAQGQVRRGRGIGALPHHGNVLRCFTALAVIHRDGGMYGTACAGGYLAQRIRIRHKVIVHLAGSGGGCGDKGDIQRAHSRVHRLLSARGGNGLRLFTNGNGHRVRVLRIRIRKGEGTMQILCVIGVQLRIGRSRQRHLVISSVDGKGHVLCGGAAVGVLHHKSKGILARFAITKALHRVTAVGGLVSIAAVTCHRQRAEGTRNTAGKLPALHGERGAFSLLGIVICKITREAAAAGQVTLRDAVFRHTRRGNRGCQLRRGVRPDDIHRQVLHIRMAVRVRHHHLHGQRMQFIGLQGLGGLAVVLQGEGILTGGGINGEGAVITGNTAAVVRHGKAVSVPLHLQAEAVAFLRPSTVRRLHLVHIKGCGGAAHAIAGGFRHLQAGGTQVQHGGIVRACHRYGNGLHGDAALAVRHLHIEGIRHSIRSSNNFTVRRNGTAQSLHIFIGIVQRVLVGNSAILPLHQLQRAVLPHQCLCALAACII